MNEWTVGYLIGVLTGVFVGVTTTIAIVNERLRKVVGDAEEDDE